MSLNLCDFEPILDKGKLQLKDDLVVLEKRIEKLCLEEESDESAMEIGKVFRVRRRVKKMLHDYDDLMGEKLRKEEEERKKKEEEERKKKEEEERKKKEEEERKKREEEERKKKAEQEKLTTSAPQVSRVGIHANVGWDSKSKKNTTSKYKFPVVVVKKDGEQLSTEKTHSRKDGHTREHSESKRSKSKKEILYPQEPFNPHLFEGETMGEYKIFMLQRDQHDLWKNGKTLFLRALQNDDLEEQLDIVTRVTIGLSEGKDSVENFKFLYESSDSSSKLRNKLLERGNAQEDHPPTKLVSKSKKKLDQGASTAKIAPSDYGTGIFSQPGAFKLAALELEQQRQNIHKPLYGDEDDDGIIKLKGSTVKLSDKGAFKELFASAWKGNLHLFKSHFNRFSIEDINATKNERNQSLLYCACRQGNYDIIRYLLSVQDIDISSPQAPNASTPLHGASWGDHPRVVASLLAVGADPNLKNSLGWLASQESKPRAKEFWGEYNKDASKALYQQLGSDVKHFEKVKRERAKRIKELAELKKKKASRKKSSSHLTPESGSTNASITMDARDRKKAGMFKIWLPGGILIVPLDQSKLVKYDPGANLKDIIHKLDKSRKLEDYITYNINHEVIQNTDICLGTLEKPEVYHLPRGLTPMQLPQFKDSTVLQ